MNRPVKVPEVDVDELERRLAAGAALLDVRMPDEYEEVRVPGAVLIPLPELPARLDEVPAGDPLNVICRSGARSSKACELLITHGHVVANVSGGTMAWVESGRPTHSGSAAG